MQMEVRKLTVGYGAAWVLDQVSLQIGAGEFVGIVGCTGCGKTTLARCILQLYTPTRGSVLYSGPDEIKDLTKLSVRALNAIRPDIQMVFQNSVGSLNPRMTIGQSLMEPLIMHHLTKGEKNCEQRAVELLHMVGLNEDCMPRFPYQLSGGQCQRVGIARAFAANPPIVLMDEPFSALDPMTRAELQNEIHDLQTKAQKTVVFVTHDMDEAIKLADRICIIQDGKVAQCDTPENILKHPANQYVTEFIGANRLWANPEYIRAADIMRRRPFTISKGRTVIQALQIMRHNSVDSLLVLDKGQTLLGVVWLEELIGKREADPIEYYISDDYIAVEGETSLKEIIATIDYDVSGIIPVIQHDRKLLGYLTKSIILATMSKQFVPEHTAGERSGVICPATL